MKQIHKLYLSNFLTGLVFWYGIEKLFMKSIGIDTVGIGYLTILIALFTLIFDIPSGVIADKWSRKYMLVVAALSLGICSILLGVSNDIKVYATGYIFYGLYIVSTSGTYQAIMYDSLHEEGRSKEYSKINGRAYSLFLVGAGIANIASGFLANSYSYRFNYFITGVSCLINIALIFTLNEPKFHNPEHKKNFLTDITSTVKEIVKNRLLLILAIILGLSTFVEVFKGDFGQIYMLRYVSSAQLVGILWAAYAFAWAFGGLIAHRLRGKLSLLVVFATLPYFIISLVDKWPSLIFFLIQAIASAALVNQIDTRVQEATPSRLRATITSVLSLMGRVVVIPASMIIGYTLRNYNAFIGARVVAIVAALILLVWIILGNKEVQKSTNL